MQLGNSCFYSECQLKVIEKVSLKVKAEIEHSRRFEKQSQYSEWHQPSIAVRIHIQFVLEIISKSTDNPQMRGMMHNWIIMSYKLVSLLTSRNFFHGWEIIADHNKDKIVI